MTTLNVANRTVGGAEPTYFIADIAANHDGEFSRAIDLINLAAEAGADAVKFQHFQAPDIVSDKGFKDLGGQVSHQADWDQSVYEVYEAASLPRDWNAALQKAAEDVGVHFFSTPYDLAAIEQLEALNVPAYKMGSGDITWPEIILGMLRTGKPLFAATGASTLEDVDRLVELARQEDKTICLMQCNTNYTGSLENFRHIHLNVLHTYATRYPDMVLGLSDHTPGHATVLGSVALGAKAVEKHFTDDTSRKGPDHGFSMDPVTWREMVDRTRELELAMGSDVKDIVENESDTVVVQRRSIRLVADLPAGHVLTREDLEPLRPAPRDGLTPVDLPSVIGMTLMHDMQKGDYLRQEDVGAQN